MEQLADLPRIALGSDSRGVNRRVRQPGSAQVREVFWFQVESGVDVIVV
jgi:hypothetical protein